MADNELLSPHAIRQLLRYDPGTGKLYWLKRDISQCVDYRAMRVFNTQFAGKEAFTCRMGKKHLQGRIFRRPYLAHRVVWALVYGEWPNGQIDHINGNPIDNRLSNLRDIPSAENQRNMRRPSNNTSGVSGVSWNASHKKWRVRISRCGKEIMVGRFSDFGEAVQARAAALLDNGYHPNHGRVAEL